MQFIILAAGKGNRLDMNISNKCFVKIHNKTLLDYNLELATPDLFDEIIIIVGYNSKYIIDYVGDFYNNIKVTYVYQKQIHGIAHAIKQAVPFIKDDFLMVLSDELHIKPQIHKMFEYFKACDTDCLCGTVVDSEQNIQKAYTMELDSNNTILKLVEKPTYCFNSFKGTGLCIMKLSMLCLLDILKPNEFRHEYEMGDWIQLAIDTNYICKVFNVSIANFNINHIDDISDATNHVKREE